MKSKKRRFCFKRAVSVAVGISMITSSLSLFMAVPAQAGPNAAASPPAVIHISDPTYPDQTLSVQGDSFAPDGTTVSAGRVTDGAVSAPPAAPAMPGVSDTDGAGAEIIQINDNSLSAVIPAAEKNGIFRVLITTANGSSAPRLINRASAEWAEKSVLQAGQPARIFGRNFGADLGSTLTTVRAYLAGNSYADFIPVSAFDNYSFTAVIPSGLGDGDYKLWYTNGFGGQYGWSDPLTVAVGPDAQSAWPSAQFSVPVDWAGTGTDPLMADPTGRRDSTAAIQAVIDRAGANGGGTVNIPPGRYDVEGTLIMPKYTVLNGVMGVTWLVESDKSAAMGQHVTRYALIEGNSDFVVQNLTIDTTWVLKDICAPIYMADPSMAVQWWIPCKVEANAQYPHPWPPDNSAYGTSNTSYNPKNPNVIDNRLERLNAYMNGGTVVKRMYDGTVVSQAVEPYQDVAYNVKVLNTKITNRNEAENIGGGTRAGDEAPSGCVSMSGRNIAIDNCDLTSDGSVTYFWGCDCLTVTNTKYTYYESNGAESFSGGVRNVLWENNSLDGRSNWQNSVAESSGWFFQFGNRGSENLYIHDNYIANIVGGNRGEGIAFDGASAEMAVNYYGYASGSSTAYTLSPDFGRAFVDNKNTVAVQRDPGQKLTPGYYKTYVATIINGKGKGQTRTITDNTADAFELSAPWDVIPDGTSVFLIQRIINNAYVIGNHIDGCERAILPWGACHNFVVAENVISGTPNYVNNPNDPQKENWGIKEKTIRYPWGNSIQGRTSMYNMYLGNTILSGGISMDGNSISLDINGIYIDGTMQMRSVFRGNSLQNGAHFTLMREPYDTNDQQISPEIDGEVIEGNTVATGDMAVEFAAPPAGTGNLKAYNTVIRNNTVGTSSVTSGLAYNTVIRDQTVKYAAAGASASSSIGPWAAPNVAVNGVIGGGNGWYSRQTTDEDFWWQADYGKSVPINQLKMYFYAGDDKNYTDPVAGQPGIRGNFKIEGANDSSAFDNGTAVLLFEQGPTPLAGDSVTIPVPDGSYRYIRVSKTVREAGDLSPTTGEPGTHFFAISEFIASYSISSGAANEPPADASVLLAAIRQAEAAANGSSFTEDSMNSFCAIISAAKNVAYDPYATQSRIDAQVPLVNG
ncbi:MAG: glycoside hydrolase family 55 protein, partial [Firmicutes bacterium]|nr:glycoside hydrolase family 55 protein [Bacillota bacterium]